MDNGDDAAAAAAAEADAADLLAAAEEAAANPPPAPTVAEVLARLAVLENIQAGVNTLTNRLATVELRLEGGAPAAAAGAAGGGGPGAGGAAAAAGAAGGGGGGGEGAAGAGAEAMAATFATAVERAIRAARRGGGDESSDDDNGPESASAPFSDARARKVATAPKALDFFTLPPCARTSFPSPFRMETLRYRDDFPEASAEADEARHLTIIGAWSTRIHNEILSFNRTAARGDIQAVRGLLLRSRIYHHQLAELCSTRYDVLKETDGAVAAQLQERLLSPADSHASQARRGLYIDTLKYRDKALGTAIAAATVQEVQGGGRRRGRRGKKGKNDGGKGEGGGAAEPRN